MDKALITSNAFGNLCEAKMSEEQLRSAWTRQQESLRQRLKTEDDVEWSLNPSQDETPLRLVGGFDISFYESSNQAIACLVVLNFPDLQVVYEDYETTEMTYPYIAGFLAFREALPFINLISKVKRTEFNPQVILVDGNGLLHPRYFGSACHLGVISGSPTIGVAKSLHCVDGLNEHTIKQRVRNQTMSNEGTEDFPGETLPLIGNQGKMLGVAIYGHGRHQSRNPIYVSIGTHAKE